MNTKPEKMTKGKLLFTIVVLVLMFLLVNKVYNSCVDFLTFDEVAEQSAEDLSWITAENWDTIAYETKEKWVQAFIKSPSNDSYVMLDNLIRKQFQYPKTVKYSNTSQPLIKNGRIVDAETGTVFLEGTGEATNGFGVPMEFGYSIRFKITPDSQGFDDINVWEL